MKLNEITPNLAEKIGAKEFIINGEIGWVRVFVIRPDGCTIGRLSFKNTKLEFIKWYKDKLYGNDIELDNSDEIAYRFNWFISNGKKLTHEKYLEFVKKAKEMVPIINARKVKKRLSLPKYNYITGKKIKRKKLSPASERQCLHYIMMEELKGI